MKVSYSYLSDGTKLSALKPNGEGLVYRGPFVYTRSSGGSLSFESVSADEGRLSSAGELLYVEDYLGSVRAVVSGAGGTLLEASDYSAFGARVQAPSAPLGTTPAGITLRDHYTAQEDQAPDFAVPYTDFGARQYNTALRRWMTPDPLSEKYYGISPYAFCNNSPMVFVDRDGEFPFFANFVGAVASVSVEYISQVIGNLAQYGFSTQIFTKVDLLDLGLALGEGFFSAGTNLITKIGTKAVVAIGVEIAQNTFDINTGHIYEVNINSAGEVILNTSLSLIGSPFTTKFPTKVFKTKTSNQVVTAARRKAHDSGQGLPTDKAKSLAKQTRDLNKEKKSASKALDDNVNSALNKGVTNLLQKGLEEE